MTDQTNSKDIISLISSLLPPNEATLSSPNDAIAALTHAVLVRSGFSLREVIGVVQAQSNVLPPEWAEPAPDSPKDHGFKYTHAQSAEFMVKVIALGRKVAILGSTVEVSFNVFEFVFRGAPLLSYINSYCTSRTIKFDSSRFRLIGTSTSPLFPYELPNNRQNPLPNSLFPPRTSKNSPSPSSKLS